MPRDVIAGPRRYVLAVETGWERQTVGELDKIGVEAYGPIEEIRIHGRGKAFDIERPFLPGYVFPLVDLSIVGASTVEGVKGAISLLRGAMPSPWHIPEEAIDEFRDLEDHDGKIRVKRALATRFAKGQAVRVVDGPWTGLTGEVLTLRGPERVRVLLGALRPEMPVSMLVEA